MSLLINLKFKHEKIFDRIDAIGVSAIGVIDKDGKKIDSLSRKNWDAPSKNRRFLLDAISIFKGDDNKFLFKKITEEKVKIQNDVSALCLLEYFYGSHDRTQSMLYIGVAEGVNGAYADPSGLIKMQRHSEMGHIYPHRHRCDVNFDQSHSGCSAHVGCFESLCSNGRFRLQWKHNLYEISSSHESYDIAAYYIAQMAYIGVLTLNPDRILFGGPVFEGRSGLQLVGLVRDNFKRLNRDYLPDYQADTELQRLISRAHFGERSRFLSALTIGCLAVSTEGEASSELGPTLQELGENIIPFPRS